MDNLNDTQIRANLRTILAESGIDPNRTSFICAGGTVRVLGDLLGLHDAPVKAAQVDALEHSIRRAKGVHRVHFHLENWARLPTGEWTPAVERRKDRVDVRLSDGEYQERTGGR